MDLALAAAAMMFFSGGCVAASFPAHERERLDWLTLTIGVLAAGAGLCLIAFTYVLVP